MALWLQVLLAIVLVALCACLVPLLLQLRRTAAAVQQLAESARTDLHQVAADVHHLRERADALAELAAVSMQLPLGLSRIVAGTAQAIETLLVKGGIPWISAVVAGLKFVINFFRRPAPAAETKEAPHE
jgi:uncharacterized membrane protein